MTHPLHVVTETEWIDHFNVRLDLGSIDEAAANDPSFCDEDELERWMDDPEVAAELEQAATEHEKVLHFPPF